MIETADRNPAIVQIAVDIIFGEMPVRRARSEFVAAARTASPKRVWPSSHHKPTVIAGTMISTRSCGPVNVIEPISQLLQIGVGYCVENSPELYEGRVNVTARANSAMPIVATRTITRGALARRRITVSSTTVPVAAPSKTARTKPTQYGMFELTTATASTAAAGTPMSPTAKLMTRVERYTSTMPIAISAMLSPSTTPWKSRFAVQMWGCSRDANITRSAAFDAEEDSTREVVAFEQLCRGPLEFHFALLEEDRAVGDREGHVQRLLDDQHRLPLFLQAIDELEHALHDDRREAE